VTFFGSEVWLAIVTIVAAGILLARTERLRAAVIVASVAASATCTVVIKVLVNRPRPGALVELGAPEASFSFPSGHTLNSMVCYGIIALMVLPCCGPSLRASRSDRYRVYSFSVSGSADCTWVTTGQRMSSQGGPSDSASLRSPFPWRPYGCDTPGRGRRCTGSALGQVGATDV